MTADEYWLGHPLLVASYRAAYKLKVRHENELAWLCGAYVNDAVTVAISNTFGKKNGKRSQYMKEAMDLGLDTEIEKEAKVQKERDKLVDQLNAWKRAFERRKKSGENT